MTIIDTATVSRDLQRNLAKAIKSAQRKRDLPPFDVPEEIVVERPKQESMGDFASPVCMQLARLARMAPIKIAEQVVRRLPRHPAIAAVEVAHPGFINFRLAASWLTDQVSAILAAPDTYGNVDLGKGQRVQVEFVSANPTGPLHMGSARNAVLGDAIASVLAAAGYDVQREYYVNDGGSQMRLFGATLYARYAQALGRDEGHLEADILALDIPVLGASGHIGEHIAQLLQVGAALGLDPEQVRGIGDTRRDQFRAGIAGVADQVDELFPLFLEEMRRHRTKLKMVRALAIRFVGSPGGVILRLGQAVDRNFAVFVHELPLLLLDEVGVRAGHAPGLPDALVAREATCVGYG